MQSLQREFWVLLCKGMVVKTYLGSRDILNRINRTPFLYAFQYDFSYEESEMACFRKHDKAFSVAKEVALKYKSPCFVLRCEGVTETEIPVSIVEFKKENEP